MVSLYFQMKRKTVFVVLIATLAFEHSLVDAVRKAEQLRPKRTLSWPSLPSFFGGGSSAPAEAAPVEEDVPSVQVKVQGPQIVGPYPDASIIGPIISRGQLVNNQLHYPIWRVHKYNGVHLQPLPVSLVHDTNGVPIANGGAGAGAGDNVVQSVQSIDTDSPTQVTSTPVESWLSPELIQMARQFGLNDFKNLPSLEQAMELLGTTTREDTNAAIKEYATTEGGRDLIRQFVLNGGLGLQDDNEVAASENWETIQTPEGVEVKASDEPVAAASTQQNFFQPLSGNLLTQLASLSARPAQSEQQQEADDSDAVETTTSASLFGRLTQWASFLNPLTNRQEIPIPPSRADVEVRVSYPKNLNDEHIANQNTVPLPPLPELAPLPSIPGAEQAPPPLPNIHIPVRYIGPKVPFTNGFSGQGGPYVRVKLPLAGFNPTPEYNIDPKYLHYGRNQLQQQRVSQVPYVLANVQERTPLQVPVSAPVQVVSPQIRTPVLVNSQASQLQLNQSPAHSAESVESLQLPTLESSSFSQSEATSGSVSVQPAAQSAPVLVNQTPRIHLTQSSSAFAQPSVVQQPIPTAGVQSQQSIVSAAPVTSSVQANQRIRLIQAPLAASTFERPIHVSEPTQYVSQNLHLPSSGVFQPFRPVFQKVGPPRQALHVGELPLVATAGYEVIPNGPKALSSYGVPYEYFYYTGDDGSNALVNRDYELRPAATETKDVTENANVDAKSANVNDVEEDPHQNEIEDEEKIEIARSNSNDKTTTDADRNDEIDQDQSSVSAVEDKTKTEESETETKAEAETDSKDIDNEENIEQADVAVAEPEGVEPSEPTEPTPEKPTTIGTVYDSLRPRMKIIRTQSEEKRRTHIQRISPHEGRTNKIYRADPKAMEMMPFTMEHMVKNNVQTEDVRK